MSVKHAVLGLLIERPDYGYSLVKRLENRLSRADWAESNVYSVLDQLEDEELIVPREARSTAAQRRGARRQRYAVTVKGEQHFEEWMAQSSPLPPERDELRMKIALCRDHNIPRLIELAGAQEQWCMDRLGKLKANPGDILDDSAGVPEVSAALLRDAETTSLEATMAWLLRTRRALKRLAARSSGGR